jgi:phospholipase C
MRRVLALTACVLAATVCTAARSQGEPTFTTPIEHVVIIFQENHSFDNVLGLLCVQDQRCDGATTATLSTGETYALTEATDKVANVPHLTSTQVTAINGGTMNGFDLVGGCTPADGYACLSQYTQSGIPNLWALAEAFAISDRTFENEKIPSWGAHLELAAQTLDGFLGSNPVGGSEMRGHNKDGWGCVSHKDAEWRDKTTHLVTLQPACIPDRNGAGPYRPSPVPWVPTIMDRLDAKHLSYKLYTELTAGNNGYKFDMCSYFWACANSEQASHSVTATDILTDAASGNLPNFAFALPWFGATGPTSQHNGTLMHSGDNWIGQVLSAIMNGPDWDSTAVFITYDDCGCFYDHVPPPPGLGIREPMVIVSPWVRAGFTDSNVTTFSGMVAFAEHALGLRPLTRQDANAYGYADAFDYTQDPLPPIPMMITKISKADQKWVATHPPPDDET